MDIDDPESFLRNLPSTRYYISQELQRAGFHWNHDWNKNYDDDPDDERDAYPEEGAFYKHVHPPGWDGYRVSSVTIQSESGDNPDTASWYVTANNVEGQQVAVYKEHLPLVDAARLAQELAAKLDNGELEVVDNKFYPVNESSYASMKLNEGRHKPGCTCGFCKNMGRFGKKKDDAPKDEPKDEPKTESRARAIVKKLLDA